MAQGMDLNSDLQHSSKMQGVVAHAHNPSAGEVETFLGAHWLTSLDRSVS